MESYEKYCQDKYLEIFNENYNAAVAAYLSNPRHTELSETKANEFETSAQKAAMKQTIVEALLEYPSVPSYTLWRAVRIAHMHRKSKISDLAVIANVISADQSWKKSSGHAFEEVIKEYASVALSGDNIEIILQRDLTVMLDEGTLANDARDLTWLELQRNRDIFDLYAIVKVGNDKYCYGCIQSKTSIRDRVSRDREPSVHAMNELFWSVIVALDEEFMHMPKFIEMVNGGTEEYPENGWHGMYILSEEEFGDRIYKDTIEFEKFRKHAVKAADDWLKRRKWFDGTWRAE